MIRKMVLLVAFTSILPCLAFAGSVSFTTTGTFSNPTLFPITFTGVSYTNVNANGPGGNNLVLGTFTLGVCKKPCKGSESFTLTIDQTSPTSGSGDLIAKVMGMVNAANGHVHLKFSAASITIGSVTYSIPFNETINFKNKTTLNGNVLNSVPEPDARLFLGLGMLGLMGWTMVSRKRINV